MMNRDEVLEFEHGIFKQPFLLFERIVGEVNIAMSALEKNIQFSVINSYEFNAHARKIDDNNYTIKLRSGIIPMTFQIIQENTDFFVKKYPELKDIETSIGLGSIFVWTQIFTHELGHIIRGHVDMVNNKSTNLVDDDEEMSMVEMPTKSHLEKDQVKMLMEFDADIFSSFFVAKVIINTIKNAKKEINVEERTIVSLAITSIFFFFNYVCEVQGKSTKYPPAMIRMASIHSYIIKYISGKTSLSDDELSKLMEASRYDAYSFLVDENSFKQSLSSDELEYLAESENHLLSKYPVFKSLISDRIILEYEGMD